VTIPTPASCYWQLDTVNLGSVGPPAQLGVSVHYAVIDPAANVALVLADGSFGSSLSLMVACPATVAQITAAAQAAIQAAEAAYSLAFVAVAGPA
jgi:hypothetical protein